MAYDNNMTGVLFKNHKKRGEKDPDYTGSAEVDGKKLKLAAWINEIKQGEKAGQKFMKLKFSPEGGSGGGDDFPC